MLKMVKSKYPKDSVQKFLLENRIYFEKSCESQKSENFNFQ